MFKLLTNFCLVLTLILISYNGLASSQYSYQVVATDGDDRKQGVAAAEDAQTEKRIKINVEIDLGADAEIPVTAEANIHINPDHSHRRRRENSKGFRDHCFGILGTSIGSCLGATTATIVVTSVTGAACSVM